MPLALDRIRALRRVPAGQLRPHPDNWRIHPPGQRAALAALLRDIGYAGALIARELRDGSLELIDGHLRAATTPDQCVPVLVVDLSDDEARLLLAAHDPLATLAEADADKLAALLASTPASDAALRALFDGLLPPETQGADRQPAADALAESFQVLVQCANEAEQRAVYERLTAEGLACRLLTM
jgi:hypothetical protein